MKLVELTGRLQALCHNGYSLSEEKFKINGAEYTPEDVKLVFPSEVVKGGEITVKIEG